MKSIQDGLHANDEMNLAVEEIKVSGHAMAQAIEKLIEANRSISGISRDLEEVSLQTKILAINAGVEAAHAGERGATFMVVADQIKSIAERCKDASVRTENAIKNSLTISESAIQVGQQVEENIRRIIIHQQDVAEVLTRLAAAHGNGESALPAASGKPLVYDAKSMSTGVRSVDDQHQALIDMVNQLEQAANQGKARGEIDRMLNFLGEYVQKHFAEEEAIMTQRRCSSLEKNKKAHAVLIDTYVKWRQKYEAEGAKLSLIMDLKGILGQWLVSHICGIDRCLRDVSPITGRPRPMPSVAAEN